MGKDAKPKGKAYIPLFFLMVIVLICSVVGYVFIEQKDKSFTNTSSGMGVQVHQMLYGNEAELAAKTVRESIEELENKISYDIAESDIERINSGAGEKWVRVSDETIDALDKIISVSKKSKGTLDPTVLPLVSLWGLDCNTVKYPQKALIEKTLANVDYRDIKLNYEVKRVKIGNKNGAITLKQIEKGVACNKAIEIYKNMKVDYGVVSIGGTVGVYGEKPDSSLWKIAVKAPFALDKEDSRIAHIKIKEGYVATFGLKEDKINMNGAFKNKILDLRNGYPVENDIELVSVLHPDAIVASALAQICCVLNKEESLEILNYYGAEAIFVYNDKNIYITPKIRENCSIIDSSYFINNNL